MSAKSQIVGTALNAYLNSRPAKYALYDFGRLLRGGRRHARLYGRADDPYSHLLVQAAPRLASAYQLEIELITVAAPSTAANPAPDMLLHHAIRDAALLAECYGLSFPPSAEPPSEDRTRRAHAVLLQRRPAEEQLKVAAEIGEAVWRDDGAALASIVERYGSVSGEEVRPALEANYAALERAGHYQPGMLYYGGEWYWGIDRLQYLEDRLRREGLEGSLNLTRGPAPHLASLIGSADGSPPRIEVFVSFRSPYSYLAMPQLIDLRDRYFGHVCDPLGKGIGYCMAVFFDCAVGKGLELELAHSVMQGIWAEARDVAHVPDMVFLAERAGIGDAEVRAGMEDRSWKEKGKANREALTDLGLWGVPSMRIGSYSTWGQDRIPLLEAEIARFSAHG